MCVNLTFRGRPHSFLLAVFLRTEISNECFKKKKKRSQYQRVDIKCILCCFKDDRCDMSQEFQHDKGAQYEGASKGL